MGIFIMHSRVLKCSLEHTKKSPYRTANAVFSKIGRVASKMVTLQLINSKGLPVLWSFSVPFNRVTFVVFLVLYDL